jgi:hypothetical protein
LFASRKLSASASVHGWIFAEDFLGRPTPSGGVVVDHAQLNGAVECLVQHAVDEGDTRRSVPLLALLRDRSLDTNRKAIGNQLPNAYLPTLVAQNGEAAVRATLETRLVSAKAFDVLCRTPFTVDGFEACVVERQRTIVEAIETPIIEERLALPPTLRALDVRVEAIELALRRSIAAASEGDAALLPSHGARTVNERIRGALRKTPALAGQGFAALDRRLEYCDLRELQDVITGKSTRAHVGPRFVHKETRNTEFDRRAELRNGLRHARTLDEVACKEGDAAVIWLNAVLAK